MDPGCHQVSAAMYESAVAKAALDYGNQARQASSASRNRQAARCAGHTRGTGALGPSMRQTFAYLALLTPAAMPAFAQTFVGGNLSHQAPYGISPAEFAAAVSRPAANRSFPIPGYNISIPAGLGGGGGGLGPKIDGWSLRVGVTGGVPLASSDDDAVDKSRTVDATTLSIAPPAGLAAYNRSEWRVCAAVFAGGLRGDPQIGTDGSCAPALPDACVRQLQANAAAGTAGRDGGCGDHSLPYNCAGYFDGNSGTGYDITPIGSGGPQGRESMFFASAFAPAAKGNRSGLDRAQRRVWPVLLTWTHFGADGEAYESAGWLSCAKANQSKEVAGETSGWDGESLLATARWAISLCIGVTLLIWSYVV